MLQVGAIMNSSETKDDTSTLILPNVVDIASCSNLHHELNNLLNASNQKIVLDASNVERISTAGIQLFVSLHKTTAKLHKKLVLSSATDTVSSAFSDLGLTQMYNELAGESQS